jgi:hypothetical protein
VVRQADGQDFPQSVRGFLSLAIRKLELLYPEADSGLQYNANYSEDERIKIANDVISLLDKATALDRNFREAYTYRSIALPSASSRASTATTRSRTPPRRTSTACSPARTRWPRGASRRPSATSTSSPSARWTSRPTGPCCMVPPRPLTPEEEAADAEQKKLIEAEIVALASGEVEPDPTKGKGKGKKGAK